MFAHLLFRSLAYLICSVLMLISCAKDIPAFVPPDHRSMHNSQQDWPKNKFLALAYHDVEDSNPDQTFVSVSTEHLVQQFAWLRENGYQPVTVDQILEANRGGKPLPDKALLLTFDEDRKSTRLNSSH